MGCKSCCNEEIESPGGLLEALLKKKVWRLTTKQFALIRGCSEGTVIRERGQKKGSPFQRDGSGNIWYLAKDVLEFLKLTTHSSTNEYPSLTRLANVAKARKAKKDRKDA